MQSLNRHLLERLPFQADDELPLGSIDFEEDIALAQLLADVVALPTEKHHPIGLDPAAEEVAVHPRQPAVRVDGVGQRR